MFGWWCFVIRPLYNDYNTAVYQKYKSYAAEFNKLCLIFSIKRFGVANSMHAYAYVLCELI